MTRSPQMLVLYVYFGCPTQRRGAVHAGEAGKEVQGVVDERGSFSFLSCRSFYLLFITFSVLENVLLLNATFFPSCTPASRHASSNIHQNIILVFPTFIYFFTFVIRRVSRRWKKRFEGENEIRDRL